MAYTRQIINVGTVADDGSGDYLRDALVKVNTNFENLWDQGAVDSNIDLTGNTISTIISNLDLKLDPNGTGKIVVTANIEPDTTGTYDIGSSTKKINKIHSLKLTTDSTIFDGQASDPSGAVTGQVYYNSSTNTLKIYDGAWKNLATAGGIALTDLSVGAEASASGDGAIAYNNSTGVFTYTPPDLSTYLTTNGVSAGKDSQAVIYVGPSSGGPAWDFAVIPTNTNQLTNGAGFITTVTEANVTAHQAALSITESQISDLGSYITASSTDTLTNKSGNVSMFTNDSGYLTSVPAQSFASLTGKPTTIAGYGITDSVFLDGSTPLTGDLLPDVDNTRDLGSSSKKYNQIFATSFIGDLDGRAMGGLDRTVSVINQSTLSNDTNNPTSISAGTNDKVVFVTHTLSAARFAVVGDGAYVGQRLRIVTMGGGFTLTIKADGSKIADNEGAQDTTTTFGGDLDLIWSGSLWFNLNA